MNREFTPADVSFNNSIPTGVAGGFFIYDVSGDEGIVYADQNVIELFGCHNITELREHTGNSFYGMVHPDDLDKVKNAIKEYNSDIRKPRHYIRYRIVTKQDTHRYVEDFGRRLRNRQGKVYCYVFIAGLGSMVDEELMQIHFGNELFAHVASNTDRLTGLLNIDAFMGTAKELQELYEVETDRFATVVVFDILGLRAINETLSHAEGDARIIDLVNAVKKHMPEECLIYRGNEADILVVCPDETEQKLMDDIVAVTKDCGSPVLFGIGSTRTDSGSVPGSDEYALLRATREAQLDMRIKKLLNKKSNRSQALISLISALEAVDADTEEHVQRTQKTGIALGRRIGLSDLQLSQLQLLCLLHDIGKIAIPLEILNKPGKLNDEEWVMMQSHAEKGYQIAVATNELKPLAKMILAHHERWDGRGYPNRLKGEEIPVLSRIISIVDAYDAMVNDRCYRAGMPPEKAMQEIRDCAGTQFDPYLAQEFLALLDEYPSLSYGTKTGATEAKRFDQIVFHAATEGATKPVLFSKYTLNMDDVIIKVDDNFAAITGYTPEDAIGKMTQYDLLPVEELDYYIEQVRAQFAKGDIAYLQHPLKCKDGRVIRVICNGERYFDSSVRAYRSTILIFELT